MTVCPPVRVPVHCLPARPVAPDWPVGVPACLCVRARAKSRKFVREENRRDVYLLLHDVLQ